MEIRYVTNPNNKQKLMKIKVLTSQHLRKSKNKFQFMDMFIEWIVGKPNAISSENMYTNFPTGCADTQKNT